MKIRSVVCLALTMLLAAAAASAQTFFTVALDGAQANAGAGTGSAATGTATLTLNAAGDTLTYSIQINGLDLDGAQTADLGDNVTAMHFHNAPPAVNGPVVFGLITPDHDPGPDPVIVPAAGTLTGAWDNGDTNPLSGQLANLLAGNLYLNVHTTTVPGGEIRGQVVPVPPSVVEVPTLGGIGFAALALLLAGAGFFALRRRGAV